MSNVRDGGRLPPLGGSQHAERQSGMEREPSAFSRSCGKQTFIGSQTRLCLFLHFERPGEFAGGHLVDGRFRARMRLGH